MGTAGYQLKICDDDETIIDILDNSVISSLDWMIAENDSGVMSVTIPQIYDWTLFRPWQTAILERDTGAGYGPVENRRWFLLDRAFGTNDQGQDYIELAFRDQNILLDTRLIGYAQGTSYADKTDQYDDICKLAVTENFVSPTDTDRTLSGFAVAAGTGDAPEDTVSLSYKSVLAVCREMANASWEEGTYLVFDLVNTGPGAFEMRTYINAHGGDHSKTSNDPRLVTMGRDTRIESNWSNSKSVIYAGGMGSKQARIVKTASNTRALAEGKFARNEGFVSASGTETEAAVTAIARAELYRRRPRLIMTGPIEETAGMQYGIDYGWGDKLTCQYKGIAIDCFVSSVGASYVAGKETLNIAVKGESTWL